MECVNRSTDLRFSSPLKKWKEGVRSKFSVDVFGEMTVVSPKIGPDPDFFNGLLARRRLHYANLNRLLHFQGSFYARNRYGHGRAAAFNGAVADAVDVSAVGTPNTEDVRQVEAVDTNLYGTALGTLRPDWLLLGGDAR